MNSMKRKRLVAAGWKIGTADDFLGLSPKETQVVEHKLARSSARPPKPSRQTRRPPASR